MKPTSLTKIELDRRRRLNQFRDDIKRAQHELSSLRLQRDGYLREWHEDGTSVELLADAAGLTRQGVYDAINRARTGQGYGPDGA